MGLGFKVEELKSNYRDFGFLSSPMIMRVPLSYNSASIKGPEKKKGKRVLLRNLVKVLNWAKSVNAGPKGL